jgi:hypothetical protein
MGGEFDEHRLLRNTEHLGTDVDDTPAEFEAEVRRATPLHLNGKQVKSRDSLVLQVGVGSAVSASLACQI